MGGPDQLVGAGALTKAPDRARSVFVWYWLIWAGVGRIVRYTLNLGHRKTGKPWRAPG